MGIKRYFIISFSSILLACMLLGVTTIYTSQSLHVENQRVIYAQSQLKLLKKLKFDTNRMLKEVSDYMLIGEEELKEFHDSKIELLDTLSALRESFNNEVNYLSDEDGDAYEEERGEAEVFEDLKTSIMEVISASNKAIEYFQQGRSSEAVKVLEEKIEVVYDERLIEVLEDQVDDEQSEIDESYRELLSLIDRFQLFGISSLAIILLVIVVATASAVRTIYYPISELLDAIKRIGDGDYSPRIKNRGGELGELAENLEQMARKMAFTQTQLVQSAKLASIGQLAAGVAHEMNQPLMVISMNTQMIQNDLREIPDNPDLAEYADMISKNAKRLTHIINHLRKFSRQTDIVQEPLNVNAVAESAFTLITQQFKAHNMLLETHFSDALPQVMGNENELEQVFVNMLTNARDAVKEKSGSVGGHIHVSTDFLESDGVVRICFADDGIGIGDDILPQIFDPFFTTKDVNIGTGLGLSIAYGIIKEHRGSINVIETSRSGTTIEIRLPIIENNSQ